MKQLSIFARIYIAAAVTAGLSAIVYASLQWHPDQVFRFLLYLTAAGLASGMRVTLPGISGGMSVNFVFILIATMDLNLPQVMSIGLAGTLGQFILRRKTWHPIQLAFNLSAVTLATFASYCVYHASALSAVNSSVPILLFCSTSVLFSINTISVSGIIALTEHKNPFGVWRDNFLWTASHHLVGAAVAAVIHVENTYLGWEAAVLTAPVIYFVYRSYALHLGKLNAAKVHAQEMGDLHWRAIEALALAIDAKDETTHNHLLRVKVYATEIGKELKVCDQEMQALQAAALLHDIGKLAVPEHIISKPGKLTPEEFEKMKVHPVVGAEILERVRFPYPVVPIVRCHHEKWNGKGYPAGLKGEEIPIGARILAAVDCLDALASDRQYRRALPLDKAMEIVASESGTSFDPKVVEVLQRRYVELERMATSLPQAEEAKLSKNVKFELGEAPAAGFEQTSERVNLDHRPIDFLVSIASARHEFQDLLKLTDELGSSLSVDETLSLLATRLKRMIAHDTIVIYVTEEQKLKATFVNGEDARRFRNLEIPMGQGLSGWVVENRTPIVNGNPTVEPGYAADPSRPAALRSALSVPLQARDQVIGALTLYSSMPDFFSQDDLRILLALGSRAGMTLANAIQHQQVAVSAVTDSLTGLPNARSLFVQLASEVRKAQLSESHFAVMVIDLDGFKDINDSMGHLTGNRVLQKVAEGLRTRCREQDYVARMGGDEFVVIMPGLQQAAVKQKVEQLRDAAGRAGNVALSVGVAFYPEDGNDDEELLAKADLRMYADKQEHRRVRATFTAVAQQAKAALAMVQ
jgi:diguanylate cyclase (GGDEF)-like protein/putative nucleotidyltransferase with HDIG domain